MADEYDDDYAADYDEADEEEEPEEDDYDYGFVLRRLRQVRYEADGERAILELLEQQGAAVWPEIEARIADRRWPSLARSIDPHHLTTARHRLTAGATPRVIETAGATRGRREASVLHLPMRRGRTRFIQRAMGRKRLLYSRHQGWAQGTGRHPQGIIGVAGERVVRASFRDPAVAGRYSFPRPEGGDVASIFEVPIEGGPVDDAALLAPLNGPPVVLLVEVKNIRPWVYPPSTELYQLLAKGCRFTLRLQQSFPGILVLPVFACRRRNYSTFQMGRDLGFYVVEYHRQFVLPIAEVTEDAVREIREGLGYEDLTLSGSADATLLKVFGTALPRDAVATARRWQTHGMAVSSRILALAAHPTPHNFRELRRAARRLPGAAGGW